MLIRRCQSFRCKQTSCGAPHGVALMFHNANRLHIPTDNNNGAPRYNLDPDSSAAAAAAAMAMDPRKSGGFGVYTARPVVTLMATIFMMYWAHRMLQLQYHRHCKADIVRIMLFNQSTMCMHISGLLNVVEYACNHAVHVIASRVIDTLSAMIGGVFSMGSFR